MAAMTDTGAGEDGNGAPTVEGELGEARVLAEGLGFPEGPVWLPDGTILVTEIARGAITRITPEGERQVLAETGGGPNGLAMGPDGALYVADNGGFFTFHDADGIVIPAHGAPGHEGGSILRVDVATGEVTTVLEAVDGKRLVAPNDLVFDAEGGLWFTDHGVRTGDEPEHADQAGLLWCRADGSDARGVAWGLDAPNGVGLSPDGRSVYVAETYGGRVIGFDVTGPGDVADGGGPGRPHGGRILHDAAEGILFDSLAVDEDGRVCVATIGPGGITCVPADGGTAEHLPCDDPLTTNIAWGGADRRTAAITLSGTGRLLLARTERAGLRLAF